MPFVTWPMSSMWLTFGWYMEPGGTAVFLHAWVGEPSLLVGLKTSKKFVFWFLYLLAYMIEFNIAS